MTATTKNEHATVAGWQRMSLREANISLIDCEHRTPPARDSGRHYVAIPQLQHGRIDLSTARCISEDDFREWTRKAKPRPYDVVLSRRCNPGETAFVVPGMEFALGQNLVLLRSDGSRIYPPFLRWLVRSPDWWDQVQRYLNVGAVFDSLKCADVPKFEVSVPSLAEQEKIADFLNSLDDKIELNRRMGETLETMARALFKSWFVDFDPVRAKAEGRWRKGESLPGLPAHLYDLFPDCFENSELGEIPSGWHVGRLEDAVLLQRGFDLPSKERSPGKYPVFAAGGMSGLHNEFRVAGPGVVTGRSGVLGNVFYAAGDFWPLNTTLWVKEFRHFSPAFAFHALGRLNFGRFNAGSAVPTLNRNHIHSLPTLLPPPLLVSAFERFAKLVRETEEHSESNIHILSLTRDALLPKLISGEIRMPTKKNLFKREQYA